MSRPFLLGALFVLGIGVPVAFAVRANHAPAEEHEHSDGSDVGAVAALGKAKGAARLDMIQTLLKDPSPAKRLAAAEALDDERNAAGAEIAGVALKDNDSQVRVQVVSALIRNPSPQAIPYLRAALRDEDDWVRQAAVSALSVQSKSALTKLGPWVVPDLMERLDDADPKTRLRAIPALKKITGKPWKVSASLGEQEAQAAMQPWKAWWRTIKSQQAPISPATAVSPERSDAAPAIAIHTIDGREIAPATAGKITLINFWGTWCEPCRQELPGLQKLHEVYGHKGLVVVGVALSEKEGAKGLQAWCQKNGLTYSQALAEEAVTKAYGDVDEVPVSVLIDAHGRIRYRWSGERNFDTFRSAIERVMAE